MTEEQSLPEPAAGILARTHAILDQHVTPHTPGRDGWALGGGTLLSARWKHRRSTATQPARPGQPGVGPWAAAV